ncbi:MAG: hypothetical protein HYR55_08555 [Acidobacteria bacterium]|nr:hypothetical protein [Acidobacteriota bacterium]MBI3656375.1 hypothetical protein [Acidobacteriota bacterium]
MPPLINLLKRGLVWSFIGLLIIGISPSARVYGFHLPWDQGHDTFQPNMPPDDKPKDPCCKCDNSTGSPVFLANGRYFHTAVDLRIPARGFPLEVSRTYNTQDRHNGLFGYGWVFSLDTHLIPVTDGVDRFAIVRTPDGTRARYRQITDSTFAPPPGSFSVMTKLANGTYRLVDKDGRTDTFNADGNLTTITDRYSNRLTLTYTADGFISSVSDNGGRSIRFTLNANGKVASITDYTNRTISYTYDVSGRLTVVRDAAGNATTYTYDTNDRLVRITDALNKVIAQISYDNQGRATRVIDAEGDITYTYGVNETRKIDNAPDAPLRGATWVYRYDSRGLLSDVRDPLNFVERRIYDNNGQLTQVVNKRGDTTRYQYDARGNMTTRFDPAPFNYATTFTYEPNFNRMTSKRDPRGVITNYEYDAQGNLLRMTEAVGQPEVRSLSYEYDAFGFVSRIVYPDGSSERFTYNALGKVLTRTDGLNNVTSYTYDSLGRTQCQTDPNNHSTCYEYDVLNRATAIIDPQSNRAVLAYDAVGNAVSLTNSVAEISRFTYDTFHRLLTITDPLGNVTTYTYDSHGNRTSRLDPNGKIVFFKYDALDRQIRTIQKVGEILDRITANDAVTEITFDAIGNRTSLKDANGNLTRFEYDALQRLTREIRPNGLSLTHSYDEVSNRLRTLRSDGYARTLLYDRLSRVTQESDTIGAITRNGYDAMNRRITATDGNSNLSRYAYDLAGRLTSTTDPLGRVFRFEYDGIGNVLRLTDREGRIRSHTYDELDRLRTITDALNNTVTLAFDAIGRIVSFRDGNGNVTAFTYSGAGRRRITRHVYADGRFMQVEFDGVGNVVNRTDGAAITYAYDDLNRLIRRSYPSGSPDVFTYDKGGRMLTATNADATVTFAYDSVDRLTQTVQNAATLSYSYNVAGTERTLTYPGGRRIRETYDGRYRLVRVENLLPALNTLADLSYDLGDRLTTERLLNNVSTGFTYDANSNVAQMSALLRGALVTGFEYGLNREDRRLSSKRLHDLGQSERYIYDQNHGLNQFKRGTLDVSGEIPSPITQSAWTLDGAGNWPRRIQDGVTETRTHNALNQVATLNGRSLSYDFNGNLSDDGVNTYTYDFENRLTSVTRRSDGQLLSRFRYDALKRRVAKEAGGVTTNYLYSGWNVIEERVNSVPVATYVYGRNLADVLAMERGGQQYYYHANSMGTIEALTNAAGAIVERYLYDAYGGARFFDGGGSERSGTTVGNSYLFTAQRWEAESAVYDYRARQYHPRLGRFMQRDPLGYVAGANLYEYVRSSPTHFTDPYGLYEEDMHFYMTYYAAAACGLTGFDSSYGFESGNGKFSEAYMVAWADQYTDVNSKTTPMTLFDVDSRRKYHFRTTGGSVVADSPAARQPLDAGIAAGDLMLTGIGMHAYQDSWSHEGYGPKTGHATAGHTPDYPYADVGKAMQMAQNTYNQVSEFMKKQHCQDCKTPFDNKLQDRMRKLMEGKGSEQDRVQRWRDAILQDFQRNVNFASGGDKDPWAKDFLGSAGKVQGTK